MQAIQENKKSWLDKTFKLSENNTSVKTEVIAGITTFMTMAYILVVNSNILADAGMDKGAAFTATAIGAFIGSCIMGILANYPVALAPGMGLNAFFAYTVVLSMGYSWQFALCAVFIEGIIFILMSVTNIREKILDCIPNVLKDSITAGIGLFIAFVGLANCGLVTNGATILQLGNLQDPLVLLTIFGLIVISILLAKNVKGAFLIGMLIVSAVGMAIGLVEVPNAVVSSVPSMKPVFLQALSIPFDQIFSFDMFMVVLTFLFMDLFTTVGCLVGVASKGNMLDEDGKLPRVKQALLSDSIATTVGALLGTFLLARISGIRYFRVNIIACAASLLLLMFVDGATLNLLCIGGIGFFASSVFSIIYSLAFQECPSKMNQISGLMITAVAGGGVVTPILGFAIDLGGITAGLFVVLLCVAYLMYCAFGIKVKKVS